MTTLAQPSASPPPAGSGPWIVFDHVNLSFGPVAALRDVSFQVSHGETKVLLGESGAGKSVILKVAVGLLRPQSGEVRVLQSDIADMPENQLFALRRNIGFVFQESALFDSLSVRDNVAFRLEEEARLSPEQITERVRTCLSFVELEEAIDKMPAELSGGMRRRVAIARALATEPAVMLYDSPTGGLDPITAATIMELIIKLRDVNRVTALLVTHRLQDAAMLAGHCWDRATNRLRTAKRGDNNTSFLILRAGQVLFDGGSQQLRETHDAYIRHFLEP